VQFTLEAFPVLADTTGNEVGDGLPFDGEEFFQSGDRVVARK
jgi:hypothetical protein